jgi:hypothetical protein
MGMFEVKVKLANLAAPGQAEEVSLLVNTGATLSWIPRGVLQKLGAAPFSRVARMAENWSATSQAFF